MLRLFMGVFLLLPILCFSKEEINTNTLNLIKKSYPKATIQAWAKGTLDASTQQYYAILINNDDMDDYPLRLIVMPSKSDSKMVVSKSWMSGQSTLWDITMANRSIFLTFDGSGGCCSHSGSTYQFKSINTELLLIGYESLGQGLTDSSTPDNKTFYEQTMSVNLLTGKAIFRNKIGKNIELWSMNSNFKPTWRQFIIMDKTKILEKQVTFQSKKWNISNFGHEDYDDWQRNTVCGYFNSKNRFINCVGN